ncbi:peptide deformylase [Bifidobacterium choloepi]|uniref:Peptide deformylase n=1 Tax=Bifidobacterium choloepi TaxID=2614131 RepID=A0A6I5N6W0_9BIFI|nr:peptide deformylase [Bifidobacterium choloepi]NEG69541.1 peptide deformylase [Bifidobacterium choloepi]
MIRTICKDTAVLSAPSIEADPTSADDRQIAADLVDTLAMYHETCVGMAANMIGERKRIIVVADEEMGGRPVVMLNPVITGKSGRYEAEEGCLSLPGQKTTTRYRQIEVDYVSPKGRQRHARFSGFTAEIIQHEVDHCDGVLI